MFAYASTTLLWKCEIFSQGSHTKIVVKYASLVFYFLQGTMKVLSF